MTVPPRPLKERLADALAAGDRDAFSDAIVKELMPKVQGSLRREHGGALSTEECEDCVSYAVSRFFERPDGRPVENPEAYIWQTARNNAIDMLAERARLREARETATETNTPVLGFSERAAIQLVEALVDDVEVEPGWATKVVELALKRLRSAHARVIRHLLDRGWSGVEDAHVELGLKVETFRAYKSIGLKDLEALIPLVMTESGIRPGYQQIVIFDESHVYAAGVEDEEGLE